MKYGSKVKGRLIQVKSMRITFTFLFLFVLAFALLLLGCSVPAGKIFTATNSMPVKETPVNFTIAFIGDQGVSENAKKVLQLIDGEGADLVLHQGDLGYAAGPQEWELQLNGILGEDFPYLTSPGNHDPPSWREYQQLLQERIDRIPGMKCSGSLGVMSSCSYKGILMVFSGVGLFEGDHQSYVEEQLEQPARWKICSWHMNQQAMQTGSKRDEVGWEMYETCREAGAIIATAHEHVYARTHLLSSMQNQTVVSMDDTLMLQPGKTIAFVSGLGGGSIRNQDRCLPTTPPYGCKGEWAAIYTSDQQANFGALFCKFTYNGEESKAYCYFKDIGGRIADEFYLVTRL